MVFVAAWALGALSSCGESNRLASGPGVTPHVSASPTQFIAHRNMADENCYYDLDHDAADLCAQWRAAIAAEKSSASAAEAMNWTIFGSVLSGLGLIALLATLAQTQRSLGEVRRSNLINMRENSRSTRRALAAMKHTQEALSAARDSAEAAVKSVEIQDRSARLQLRAYLLVDKINISFIADDFIAVRVLIKNVGATPARITSARIGIWVAATANPDPLSSGPAPRPHGNFPDWLAQSASGEMFAAIDDPLTAASLNVEGRDIYIYGKIEYTDLFDVQQWITFAYRPETYTVTEDSVMIPCIDGNNAS